MNFISTEIPDVFIIEPIVYKDARGYFFESYKDSEFKDKVKKIDFIQDNEAQSSFGVLRGLHFQLPPYSQSKLVRVIKGKVLDVTVDIRKGSPTFGKSVCVELSEENKRQLFVPRGFAHGYLVLADFTIFSYKVDNLYAPTHDRGIFYNDPSLLIDWQIDMAKMILSEKDKKLPLLSEAQLFDYNTPLY